jgi:hypothetical protein
MLQGNWDLVVGWVQAQGVREAEAAHCRNVESEASVVVGGGSKVQHRSHWLHVAPRKFVILDRHISGLWFLVGPGVSC